MREDIIAFPRKDKTRPFSISMCGVSYCDGTYKISRAKSNIYCIEYIYKGLGYVNLDDISFMASEGDVYILPEGRKHFYYSDAENPWTKIWFNIRGDLVQNVIKSYNLENVYHIKGLRIPFLFEEFIKTAEKADSPEEAMDKCAGSFLKIMQAAHRHIYSTEKNKPTGIATRLKAKLDSLTDFDISFDTIVEEMYCTKSHAIRVFKSEYGVTPYEYLLDRKILTAKMMIKNTGMSIKEISDYLGFRDCHYFSNFFKKRTGVSPLNYRNDL